MSSLRARITTAPKQRTDTNKDLTMGRDYLLDPEDSSEGIPEFYVTAQATFYIFDREKAKGVKVEMSCDGQPVALVLPDGRTLHPIVAFVDDNDGVYTSEYEFSEEYGFSLGDYWDSTGVTFAQVPIYKSDD